MFRKYKNKVKKAIGKSQKGAPKVKEDPCSSAAKDAPHPPSASPDITQPISSYGSTGSERSLVRGYSSGASSVGSEFGEDQDVTQSLDRVGLKEIQSSLLACGEGCRFVRMETPLGKPIEEIYDGVHSGPVLGSGVAGIVREVVHKGTGVHYAVKCLDLGLVKSAEGLQALRDEIFIMCTLDYPNIMQLIEAYESETEIYLIQPLCGGGDLFDRLDEQPDFHYTEAQCCRLVKQMLASVRYLHSHKIIHRDLKLENFLFESQDEDSQLCMIDFGLSKHFQFVGEEHHDAVGTPYSVAPEVIKGAYDERCGT